MGGIRICGDYKLTVNGVAKLDTYPLPRIEDLFSSLSGGKYFSKLDLAQAYLQLPLDEASRKYVTERTIPIHQTSIWSGLCTINIPEDHGQPIARHCKSLRIFR